MGGKIKSINTWAKELNRQLTEEEMEMVVICMTNVHHRYSSENYKSKRH